jgi:exopolyphosphatase/guanosine-5'-triphosphate,3'-diphosphate pyrophosphatase
MNKHIAVIDCGTNTFTLSLFEIESLNKFKRILKDRHFVELAEEGIDKIGPKAFQRGLDAFHAFQFFLQDYPTALVFALGTAALRKASNRLQFMEAVEEISNIPIQIIDGDREALLIYKGVELAAPLSNQPSLIMDIGGGSVEFIIANNEELFWAKSYPIGGAVLFDKFHKSDPIAKTEVEQLENHLESELDDLLEILDKYSIQHLIGASGSFDVLDNLSGKNKAGDLFSSISAIAFEKLYKQLVFAPFKERVNTPNLIKTRAKLIVMSVLLINFIHKTIGTQELIASDHAMREGLVSEILTAK